MHATPTAPTSTSAGVATTGARRLDALPSGPAADGSQRSPLRRAAAYGSQATPMATPARPLRAAGTSVSAADGTTADTHGSQPGTLSPATEFDLDCGALLPSLTAAPSRPAAPRNPEVNAVDAALAVRTLTEASDVQRQTLTMECDRSAAGEARAFARKVLADWGLEELEDRVVLIVSELATNSYKHGRTKTPDESETIALTLVCADGKLLGIQMADNCSAPPYQRRLHPDRESGRGLYLVTAHCDGWTAAPNADGTGKKVWAFLRCDTDDRAA